MRYDSVGTLRVSRLQSPAGQAQLRRLGLPTDVFDSLVFLTSPTAVTPSLKTDGVIQLGEYLGGGWRHVAAVLALFPRAVRDFFYRIVAKTRHMVMGRVEFNPADYPQWAHRIVED